MTESFPGIEAWNGLDGSKHPPTLTVNVLKVLTEEEVQEDEARHPNAHL